MNNTTANIYNGMVEMGKIKSTANLWQSVVISILLIIGAIYFFNYYGEGTQLTIATITEVTSCKNIVKHTQSQQGYNVRSVEKQCNLNVSYTVNGKQYTGMLTVEGNYVVGNTLQISYNTVNPTIISQQSISGSTIGFILVGIAVLISGGSYYSYNMSQKSDTYAAMQGVNNTYATLQKFV